MLQVTIEAGLLCEDSIDKKTLTTMILLSFWGCWTIRPSKEKCRRSANPQVITSNLDDLQDLYDTLT